jgi:hypothetical protein
MTNGTFGGLFTYTMTSSELRFLGVKMLIPGYPDDGMCMADLNPATGTIWLWKFDGNDRIDYEPIKLGSIAVNGERRFKIRKDDTTRKEPHGYEW